MKEYKCQRCGCVEFRVILGASITNDTALVCAKCGRDETKNIKKARIIKR